MDDPGRIRYEPVTVQWRIQDSSDRGAQDKTSWECVDAVSPPAGFGQRPEKF